LTSHREAPAISQDPVADNTDLYAFVSPDSPQTVTMIANYVPLQLPPGGPNFFQFGDDVLYQIMIDNNQDSLSEITYQFEFETVVENGNTFLYNTGPISSLTDPNWNVRQYYSVTRIDSSGTTVLGSNIPCPPVNIGIRSTPNYESNLADAAITTLSDGSLAFAGQRGEGFAVDLGSIFDLLALRPFQEDHLIPTPKTKGVDATQNVNVHSMALQVNIALLTSTGKIPTNPLDPTASIGFWATASRQSGMVRESAGATPLSAGQYTQVSRLGNPLINEAFIPLSMKDYWNGQEPVDDSQFQTYYADPMVAELMPVLYPKVLKDVPLPPKHPREDIEIVLGTGIPQGVISGFQNYTGSTFSDMLRLNVAIPPSSNPNPKGIIGGDLAGFPNGRRPLDDTVDIYLEVAAGVIYPLIDSSFKPPKIADKLSQGVVEPRAPFLTSFPYLPTPFGGYSYEPSHKVAPL
jgi:Domain of unknown function (DUF4331)